MIKRLDPKWKDEFKVLDDLTTINGMPGVKFVDKMKRNTSMGFPWRKAKKYFMDPVEGHGPDDVDFTPEVYEEIDRMFDCYFRGERAHPVFTACLKDEPLPFKKIREKKTRVFSISNAPFSFVMRKFLLPFVRVFQMNSLIFEGAPGINCSSKSWGALRKYLTKHGLKRLIAGDYGKFDKHMEAALILVAFHFIRRIFEWAQVPSWVLQVIQCIAEDCAYSLTDFFGDLMEFMGSNPSGQVLTVIINCIVNSIYMRYCFYQACPGDLMKKVCMLNSFKNWVNLITYGDDNAMGVHPDCDWFNHTAIRDILAEIGVEYTMADKEAESVPFISIDDVSFLKRTWRWEPALGDKGDWACPLDFSSIEKMLNITVESPFICREAQAAEILRSATCEFFHYGREAFEANLANMYIIVDECGLKDYITPSTFPTWDSLVSRWNGGELTLALDPEEYGEDEREYAQ